MGLRPTRAGMKMECGVAALSEQIREAQEAAKTFSVVGQFEFLLCHPRAWLPREGSRIPGFLARQTKQTRGNDRRVRSKLTHYHFFSSLLEKWCSSAWCLNCRPLPNHQHNDYCLVACSGRLIIRKVSVGLSELRSLLDAIHVAAPRTHNYFLARALIFYSVSCSARSRSISRR